jgi:hypothetical protein
MNLVDIQIAKVFVAEELGLTNGVSIPENELKPFLQRREHLCPDGGMYLINPVGIDPECTYTGVCHTWHVNKETKRIERRTWKHNL